MEIIEVTREEYKDYQTNENQIKYQQKYFDWYEDYSINLGEIVRFIYDKNDIEFEQFMKSESFRQFCIDNNGKYLIIN